MSETPNLNDVICDLCTRFILHCPPEDLQSPERLFFHVEEAHWFYEDFYRTYYPKLTSLTFSKFVYHVFKQVPELFGHLSSDLDQLCKQFVKYKCSVPVAGAIILNKDMTKVLLVKGMNQKSSWTFPRGKINKDEPFHLCAIREVSEEIGYDISSRLEQNNFIEKIRAEQTTRLYIIRNVDEATRFETQTRNEISRIEWHYINDLPDGRNSPNSKSSKEFFMVTPWVRDINKYVSKNNSAYRRRSLNNDQQPRAILKRDSPVKKSTSQPTTPIGSPIKESTGKSPAIRITKTIHVDPQTGQLASSIKTTPITNNASSHKGNKPSPQNTPKNNVLPSKSSTTTTENGTTHTSMQFPWGLAAPTTNTPIPYTIPVPMSSFSPPTTVNASVPAVVSPQHALSNYSSSAPASIYPDVSSFINFSFGVPGADMMGSYAYGQPYYMPQPVNDWAAMQQFQQALSTSPNYLFNNGFAPNPINQPTPPINTSSHHNQYPESIPDSSSSCNDSSDDQVDNDTDDEIITANIPFSFNASEILSSF